MPDELTHVLIPLMMAWGMKLENPSLLVFGGILPDILAKTVSLGGFIYLGSDTTKFLFFGHTIPAIIIASLFFSGLFALPYMRTALTIFYGAVIHLLLDGIQHTFVSHTSYAFIWPEQYYLILIPTIILFCLIFLWRKKNAHKQTIS